MELSRPRGTRDFLFEEMKQRKVVASTLKRIFENYAYQEIKTPIFENLSLFTQKSGEEIVDQLYNFKDKGDRELALRPELTAPVARLYMAHMQKSPKPIKMYYYGSCFRYERPQAGRFRQFWQFGCEMIGGKSPEADAEIIAMASHSLKELELEGFEIHLGHLGILRGILDEKNIPGKTQDHIMGLIDKGDPEFLQEFLQEVEIDTPTCEILLNIIEMKGGPAILDEVKEVLKSRDKSLKALNQLEELLETLAMFQMDDYVLNLGIARGLDYYSGMVFEIYVPSLGAQKQICGGGTYNIIETFGGEKIESTGFAFGFDRLMAALISQKKDLNLKVAADIFVAPISPKTRGAAFEIAQKLRYEGIATEVDLGRRKLKKLLSYADNLGVKKVVLVGERDLEEGKLTIKDMQTGNQELVNEKELLEYIRS
ncbi:MAG: histidine--tRNA ligase [Euryarchaeota archaeon]|nr:histidine--tRNA ligase [Euryarchaeota archaeon]MBU4607337.1 histidine--tRNA ligase [Euryarchaeota archaeon]MBV1730328.1 histidine--tRNA ligase [Methanobacterium sp.]MBV1754250.1 histidine--tRNA ligase [Methanobacterium sp.]